MAQRRMFSPDILCSDEFLEMPPTSQNLYTQLAIRADDDGFVQPKTVMRLLGSTGDDLKILVARRFILPFESGVVVIKHWLIHNMIRTDRYKPTRFQEERKMLQIKENKAYTELSATNRQPTGNQPAPQVRLGKVRLGKDSKEEREEKIVPSELTPTPGEVAHAFFDVENPKHQEYWETTLGWLLEKGIPLALAEKELRKFGNYWSEKNKSGKKMLWETKPTFELNRRLATWFGNIEKRYGGIDNSRVGKNYDKE